MNRRLPPLLSRVLSPARFVPVILLVALAPQTGARADAPTPIDATAPTWPMRLQDPPGHALDRLPTTPRTALCDFAAHAMAAQPTPFELDPVFRQVPPEESAQVRAMAEAVVAAKTPEAQQTAREALRASLHGEGGIGRLRMGLTLPDVALRTVVAEESGALPATHPRVSAFVAEQARHDNVAWAKAVVQMLFASRCDAPVLYAYDGLKHPSVAVRIATIDLLVGHGWRNADTGGMSRITSRLSEHAEPDPTVRVRLLRAGLVLGVHSLAMVLDVVSKDTDERVRAEALVLRAATLANFDVEEIAKACRVRSAVLRAGALRAAAVLARPSDVALLREALADRAKVRDAVTGESLTIGELARALLTGLGEPAEG